MGSPGYAAHAAPSGRTDPFEDTLRRLREAFHSGCTRPATFRAEQLQALGRFLQENKQLLHDALAQDLHKSAFDSDISELILCQNEIDLALKNLQAWMKDTPASTDLFTKLDSAFVRKEPFGLVLIITPWNYPMNLSLVPLVGALAAAALPKEAPRILPVQYPRPHVPSQPSPWVGVGTLTPPVMAPSARAGNCVVLKPSEISRGTEKVLAEVLPRYLDQVRVALPRHPHASPLRAEDAPLAPEPAPEQPVLPCRAALLWCWVGLRRRGSCWSTSSTTSSSRVRGPGRGPRAGGGNSRGDGGRAVEGGGWGQQWGRMGSWSWQKPSASTGQAPGTLEELDPGVAGLEAGPSG
ncbi:hypothetical protein P7K49_021375 [Saguinus oedipus]|uniref:Aldehyde dehydrogenase domain-containing protein n=1 Tax=Saguinus oedipus TaxID=9490 RepID=A0ABQ9UUV0_SAGOE|nr:hypothetical protein P7K49_021375 [Saguinus oedipus]